MSNSIKPFPLLVLSGVFFLFSCGSAETESADGSGRKTSSASDTTGGMKIYLLPSPLQVASVLKLSDAKYSEKILEKTEKAVADYQVSNLKALSLGVYCIDMGYSAAYNDYPIATKYAAKIQALMADLGIKNGFKGQTLERAEHYRNNNDSLYKIILESYRNAHEYFKTSEREDVGLLILTGAFVEGLYLSSSQAKTNNNPNIIRFIGLQKTFLQNILELLKKYEDKKDVQTVILKLGLLEKTYSEINVSYDSEKDKLTASPVSSDQLNRISLQAAEVRNEIIN